MTAERRWLVLRVQRPAEEERAALLGEALMELGGRAVLEEGGSLLTHVAEPEDSEAFLAAAEARLAELAGPGVVLRSGWQPHEEWAETWKRGLAPRRLGKRLVVTPTWEAPETRPGDVVVVLDPGMAFGNAEHGTTRGCLRLLEGCVRAGERLLDLGSGSGILAIAAARLGAAMVVAVEGDPLASEAARENFERNGVAERVRWLEAWADPALLATLAPFDGVLANLEAGILRPLMPALAGCVREGGWVILSGILASELGGVRERALAAGLLPEGSDEDGEWRSLLLRREAPPSGLRSPAAAR